MTRETITVPAAPGLEVTVDAPEGWLVERGPAVPAFVAVQPEQGAGPFRDNLVVSIEALPADAPTDLETVQSAARAQALATVPDYHLIDDRPMDVGGLDGWFRASLHSSPSGTSVVVRQLFAVHASVLITIALTTLPFRDAEASELFEHIVAGCDLHTEKGTA